MEKISIVLIDDHRLFRKGIDSLIQTFTGYRVVFDAGGGQEFMEWINNNSPPEIVLLDLNMPLMSGLQLSVWLREHYPSVSIIVLSMVDDEQSVISLIKTGIKGYLLKDAEPSEFRHALDEIVGGGVYFPAFVSRYMAEKLNRADHEVSLNQREVEFIRFAASELTYKEIADKMCVSLRTVDGYRDSLFVKLNIKNRVGLALYAVKNKIVEL